MYLIALLLKIQGYLLELQLPAFISQMDRHKEN